MIKLIGFKILLAFYIAFSLPIDLLAKEAENLHSIQMEEKTTSS